MYTTTKRKFNAKAIALAYTLGLYVYATLVIPSYVASHVCTMETRPGWKSVDIFVGNSTYGSPKTWNSQVGQDRTISNLFHRNAGFFVDLAANDAVHISNTYSLEQNDNWDGICIEANPNYIWGLAHRKCEVVSAVAWNVTNKTVDFTFTRQHEFGGILSSETDNKQSNNETIYRLPTVSLTEILDDLAAPLTIHYLSLDVEGAEEIIMRNFAFDRYTILAITVERPSANLINILRDNSYTYVMDHGWFGDKLFVHSTVDYSHISTINPNLTSKPET